jgi:adenylosuccinate lyase
MIERYSLPQMKKVWSEANKFDKWLQVEIAVCQAWSDLGKIPKSAINKIKKAHYSLDRVKEILRTTHHDMTAFVNAVSENLGDESRFIHLGLTSSDVMDTALSLQLKEAATILGNDVSTLISVLENKAIEHKQTIMIGRTHGVHAEPTTFGLKMALWSEEMKRNAHRLNEAAEIINYGKISGAVGTYATIPPEVEQIACKNLGINPAPISNQILQRDRHAQFITTIALIASSLEKFATEIRHLQRTEVLEVEEPFSSGQTGSSAMPHKRNPELCERICGLSRLIRGHSVTAMENIALWHERDISHSSNERIIFPDSCLALDYILNLFTSVMEDLQVHEDNMADNLELTQGLIFSQRVLIALIEKGLTRKKAYELVQRNAMKAWKERTSFLKLLKKDNDISKVISKPELERIFDYSVFFKHVDTIYKRLKLNKTVKNRVVRNKVLGPQTL